MLLVIFSKLYFQKCSENMYKYSDNYFYGMKMIKNICNKFYNSLSLNY